jgi:hypothetical protein
VSARGATDYEGARLLRRGSRKGRDVLAATRANAPDPTIRTYYLASIATRAESNNVANSGRPTQVCGVLSGRTATYRRAPETNRTE